MNPYDPPQSTPIAPWQPPETFEPVIVRIENTSEHMSESVKRALSLRVPRMKLFSFLPMGIVPISILPIIGRILIFVIFLAYLLYRARIPMRLQSLHLPILALPILVMLMSWLFAFLMRARMSPRYPNLGQATFTLSESGMHAVYPNWIGNLTWNLFTEAAVFDDGVLLMQDAGLYWLPYQAIDGEYGQERIIALVKSKIPKLTERRKK